MTTKTNKGKKKQEKKKEVFVYENKTPKGEKKVDIKEKMEKEYHPVQVESAWYDWWEKSGYFTPELNSEKPKFVIVIPPPNVTGTLHLGHALTVSIEDCLVRWHRMMGYNCLYVPGVDHAGIATQVVVEKRLMKLYGKTRHDYSREDFLKEVWKWKEEYGNTIINQLRRVGASLDWTRECFTMDEKRSKAVTEAFVRMFEKGYIYRATRLVNWCPALKTAISNIEVDDLEFTGTKKISVPGHDPKKKYEFGCLVSFAYKVENSDEEIIIATTRPETMLGDTAIAVHPNDERYKHLHGKFVIHPFNGRRIPIICDEVLVDPTFGTGAVKVTPAHDPNDFECGKRHNLEFINILNDDGTINENGAPFTGMMRYDARTEVVKALEEKKLLRGKKDHAYTVGICSRSGDIVEPMIKPQWFCDCKKLAKRATDAVRNGELKILPEFHKPKWFEWLDDIQDWCISRQLWWGHRIPAYYVKIEGKELDKEDINSWVVARNENEAMEIAKKRFGTDKITLEQDEDVLDTWFSSGLFPFSTMGWPEDTQDLKEFYPNTLLETGHDILFFWVARMVMMGLALTDKLPFNTVYLHAMVRDKFGRKMSKSRGNVIDPVDVIQGISLEELHKQLEKGNLPEKEIKIAMKGQKEQFPNGIPECGVDAMRFTLLNYSANGRDINLDIMRVFGYRTFCNKLWNTVAFALMHLKDYEPPQKLPGLENREKLRLVDKWILSRLEYTISTVIKSLKDYDFATYTNSIYDFWMKELCSVYLELIKPVMNADQSIKENVEQRKIAQDILYTCIEICLRLLHPSMPFVTEELWQRLPGHQNLPKERESIMINPYPKEVPEWRDLQVEKQMDLVRDIIKGIRSTKANYNLTNKDRPPVFIQCSDPNYIQLVSNQLNEIAVQAFSGEIKVIKEDEKPPVGCSIEVIDPNCKAYILLKGYIDFDVEIKKLEKNKAQFEKLVEGLKTKMANKNYDKVPENVKEQNKLKLEEYSARLENILKALENLENMRKEI